MEIHSSEEAKQKDFATRKTEKLLFKAVDRPYAIFSVIAIIWIIVAKNGVGILNEDVAYGVFISWITLTFVTMINSAFFKQTQC